MGIHLPYIIPYIYFIHTYTHTYQGASTAQEQRDISGVQLVGRQQYFEGHDQLEASLIPFIQPYIHTYIQYIHRFKQNLSQYVCYMAVSLTFVYVSVGDVCHGFYDIVDSLHRQVGLLRLLHGLVEQHLLDC